MFASKASSAGQFLSAIMMLGPRKFLAIVGTNPIGERRLARRIGRIASKRGKKKAIMLKSKNISRELDADYFDKINPLKVLFALPNASRTSATLFKYPYPDGCINFKSVQQILPEEGKKPAKTHFVSGSMRRTPAIQSIAIPIKEIVAPLSGTRAGIPGLEMETWRT